MRNKRFILFTGAFLLMLFSSFVSISLPDAAIDNNPPVVKIISPSRNSFFSRNTLVAYEVNVSDKEDGESKYQEIPSEEIFMEVRYFPDASKAEAYIKKGIQKDPEGLMAIKRSDCFNCHTMKAKLIGPSFEEINERYISTAADPKKLAEHIQKGSTGIWGEIMMPAHPSLSEKEANSMVDWILKNSGDPNVNYYRGMEGTFWCKPSTSNSNGVYVLTATYNDHGVNDNPESSLKGQDMIMISEKK